MVRKRHSSSEDGDNRFSTRERRDKRKFWMYIGVAILILLLIVWLTIASLWEDTDVAAFIPLLLR